MPTKHKAVYHEVLGIGIEPHIPGVRPITATSTLDHMTSCPSPTRPTSSLDYCDQGLKLGPRPKSTPYNGMKGRNEASSSPSTLKISRPKTAAVILGRTECERVHQLEHEATRRHNFENHLPLKKAKPPPWQKNLEQPLVPVVTAPGYILSRSKSKFAVTLKEDFFDYRSDDSARPPKSTSKGARPASRTAPWPSSGSLLRQNTADPERDGLIAQLQQQISDLTLYLEEERMNHRQTKQKGEEYLKDTIDQLNSQHQDRIRDLDTEHKDALHKQKSELEAGHKEYQTVTEKQISRMAKEIEFLQGAFESYKSTLHTETWDKWKVWEGEMNHKHSEDKQAALQDMKTKLGQERTQERLTTSKEHQRAMDILRKDSKREMDSLTKRFANAAADFQRLQRATAELEETKSDLDSITKSYNETCHQLTYTTHQLTDAKVRLMDWEKRFQEKITTVDDKYRSKLQELMSQNTELKRLFVQKCGELFNEKSQSDKQTFERVKTAKETIESLIKSRQRLNLSIAVGGPLQSGSKVTTKPRPLSAPGTRQEVEEAQETAGDAGEMDKGKSSDDLVMPYIHLEPNPSVEELRDELLLSCRE